jgi:hypothetical protein
MAIRGSVGHACQSGGTSASCTNANVNVKATSIPSFSSCLLPPVHEEVVGLALLQR